MAKIYPFRGILPAAGLAGRVAVNIESMSLEDAKAERDNNPDSFLHMLVPEKNDNDSKEAAFERIRANFEQFQAKGIVLEAKEPCFYIVSVSGKEGNFRGIWACTSTQDYLNNALKKHEQISPEREERIRTYFAKAGLDTNPVLIIYEDRPDLNLLIENLVRDEPTLCFEHNELTYSIGEVAEQSIITAISNHFENIEGTYIADGHHRAAAALESGMKMFSSVYVPASKIEILPFHRLIKDLNGHALDVFLMLVRRNFHINQMLVYQKGLPGFAMYVKGLWFSLIPKDHLLNGKTNVSNLSVYQLNQYILEPVLEIDPKDFRRISYRADITAADMQKLVDAAEFEAGFFLNSITVADLTAIADANEFMPPKSTFILPKFPAGLIVRESGNPKVN